MPPLRTHARRRRSARGFTLVEVLATLLLMGIVLPVAMRAVTLSTTLASDTRRRSEAAGLAESKLNELIATGQWNGGVMTGDFAADGWPDYAWTAEVNNWYSPVTSTVSGTDPGNSLSEIDLHVSWRARNREFSVTVSTLVYQSNQSSSTSGSTSSSSSTT